MKNIILNTHAEFLLSLYLAIKNEERYNIVINRYLFSKEKIEILRNFQYIKTIIPFTKEFYRLRGRVDTEKPKNYKHLLKEIKHCFRNFDFSDTVYVFSDLALYADYIYSNAKEVIAIEAQEDLYKIMLTDDNIYKNHNVIKNMDFIRENEGFCEVFFVNAKKIIFNKRITKGLLPVYDKIPKEIITPFELEENKKHIFKNILSEVYDFDSTQKIDKLFLTQCYVRMYDDEEKLSFNFPKQYLLIKKAIREYGITHIKEHPADKFGNEMFSVNNTPKILSSSFPIEILDIVSDVKVGEVITVDSNSSLKSKSFKRLYNKTETGDYKLDRAEFVKNYIKDELLILNVYLNDDIKNDLIEKLNSVNIDNLKINIIKTDIDLNDNKKVYELLLNDFDQFDYFLVLTKNVRSINIGDFINFRKNIFPFAYKINFRNKKPLLNAIIHKKLIDEFKTREIEISEENLDEIKEIFADYKKYSFTRFAPTIRKLKKIDRFILLKPFKPVGRSLKLYRYFRRLVRG